MKLQGEPEFKTKLKFRGGDPLFLVNDRLAAPNTEETFAALRPELEAALAPIYSGTVALQREASDPRSRFAVRVQAGAPVDLAALQPKKA